MSLFPIPGLVTASVAEIALTDHKKQDGAGDPITFSSAAIGTAAADRLVACCLGVNNSRTLSSATIGGQTATLAGTQYTCAGGQTNVCFFALVTSGTTADIVCDMSGATGTVTIGVWRVVSANPAFNDVCGDKDSDPLTDTLTIPQNGVAFGQGYGNAGSYPSYAWTNLTEDYDDAHSDANWSHGGASQAYDTLQTDLLITCNQSEGTTDMSFSAASFAPA